MAQSYEGRLSDAVRAADNANEALLTATVNRDESERRSNLRARITYAIGGVVAFVGTVVSFLEGANWSAVFSPEGAAVAGAGVVFVRALVVFIQKRPTE